MNLVDPRTLILMASLLGALMALVLELLRRSIPEPVPGLREWAQGTWLAFGAAILFGLRGRVPDLLSVTLANATLSTAFLLHLAGTRRFFGAPMPWRAWLAALAAAMAAVAWFTHVEPSFRHRLVVVVALFATIVLHHAQFLWRHLRGAARRRSVGQSFTLVALALLGLVFVGRGLHAVAVPAPEADHLLATHWVQTAYTASYTVGILMIALGFALWASDSVRERFEHQAMHDPLTHARNRRALQPLLDHELERSRRYGRAFSLLLMDLDHFKAVNDRHGHAAGDAVLRQFARRVQAMLRPSDAFARWGGEEFVALLPETSLDDGLVTARRVVAAAAGADDPGAPPVTVSVGVAAWQPDDRSIDDVLRRADQALYRAKRGGRARAEAA